MSMEAETGLRAAIGLFHLPSRVRTMRDQPLPLGVDLLLRIAAGDVEAEATAITSTGHSRDLIRQAAIFFIEQVLLSPNSDSYRVLGSDSRASNGELRRNMALLIKLLHPDKDPQGQRFVFANRINQAWNDLKTPERRATYDESRGRELARKRLKTNLKSKTRASSKRMLSSPSQLCLSLTRIAESQSLLSRAWLFLLRVARQLKAPSDSCGARTSGGPKPGAKARKAEEYEPEAFERKTATCTLLHVRWINGDNPLQNFYKCDV